MLFVTLSLLPTACVAWSVCRHMVPQAVQSGPPACLAAPARRASASSGSCRTTCFRHVLSLSWVLSGPASVCQSTSRLLMGPGEWIQLVQKHNCSHNPVGSMTKPSYKGAGGSHEVFLCLTSTTACPVSTAIAMLRPYIARVLPSFPHTAQTQ